MLIRFRANILPAFLLIVFANFTTAQVRLLSPESKGALVGIAPNTSAIVPQPLAPIPASGSGYSQTFTFKFTDQNGWQNFNVLDVLINNTLNGGQACYFALVPTGASAGKLYLASDSGPETLSKINLPGSGSLSNSHCTLTATGASVSANSTTLTLVLPITFNSAFAGNMAFYLAAQDTSMNNSGWQPLATWNVPGAASNGPGVIGMSPARNTGSAEQTYTFTLTDSNGWQNLSVIDVLINSAVQGRSACYFALAVSVTSEGTMYLVSNGAAGDPTYAGVAGLPSAANIKNSQCTLSLEGATVDGGGNALTLTMPITFSNTFTGNKLFLVGAREANATSGWQAIGSISLP
jgi:hypothetical protein